MKNIEPTNPSAYPYYESNDHAGQVVLGGKGMTLRDYFAAKAMQAYIHSSLPSQEMVAEKAYEVADAMLKQREL